MNELEKQREYRRWRFWKMLSRVGRIFKFGTIMRTDSSNLPSSGEGPPMLELEKLAKEGLPKDDSRATLTMLENSMTLFVDVVRNDTDESGESSRLAREFIRELGPEDISGEDVSGLMDKFRSGIDNFQQIRNDLFMLKKQMNQPQVRRLIEYLYRAVYSYGIDSEENRQVADYAQRLNLSNSDIRLIAAGVRRDMDNEDVGNANRD